MQKYEIAGQRSGNSCIYEAAEQSDKDVYKRQDQNFVVSDRQSFTYIVQFMKYRKKMTGYLELAPKVGGDNIACVSMFGFPEKMNKQAPEARERIEKELLK